MAGLAAHPVVQLEDLGPLFGRNVERVANQALGSLIRAADIQDFADSQRHGVRQYGESARVFVLGDPDAVFVLKDTGDGLGLDAAMTTAGGASSRADVLPGDGCRAFRWAGCQGRGNQK
jgi:hypothetical protein